MDVKYAALNILSFTKPNIPKLSIVVPIILEKKKKNLSKTGQRFKLLSNFWIAINDVKSYNGIPSNLFVLYCNTKIPL